MTDVLMPAAVFPNPQHGEFDPAESMVRAPFASPGYHTTLRGGDVHPTRETLEYAADLWAAGLPEARARAIDILQRVLALQDQDETSKTYGLWSWFLEEPLEQMSPPDWNWADFCARPLLEIARSAHALLPDDLATMADRAIRHCAESVRRRNVNLDYTNIAIMGTYVTLAAGQHLDWEDMTAYALDRLRRFHKFTLQHGSLVEYNSPTYTTVALEELTRLRGVCPPGEPAEMTDALIRLTWEQIAEHFHPPTAQWAGPHSRCYSTLIEPRRLILFEQASKNRLHFSHIDHAASVPRIWNRPSIPTDLLPRFQELHEPREVIQTFDKLNGPIVGTTYLHPKFVLSSSNFGELWRQQRPLLAYWGTAEKPSYLRLRFLRNGDDLHAGELHCVQEKGTVLAGIGIASDQGLTHSFFDRISNARLTANDLRIRIELGGDAASAALTAPDQVNARIQLRLNGLSMQLHCPFVEFSSHKPHWTTGRCDSASHLDLVLYHGPDQEYDLNTIAASACLGLHIDHDASSKFGVDLRLEESRFVARCGRLFLSFPRRSMRRRDFRNQG